jgi:hypothetical protein
MEKYGYKNISSRNEFQKGSKKEGKINYGPAEMKHLTNYDFIDFTSQGSFGMPGETRYSVKTIDDLIKANEKISKQIIKKRNPKGYVGW